MNSKYKTIRYKQKKSAAVDDLVSIEEPLEMIVRYRKNNKWMDNSISITMRSSQLSAIIGVSSTALLSVIAGSTIFIFD